MKLYVLSENIIKLDIYSKQFISLAYKKIEKIEKNYLSLDQYSLAPRGQNTLKSI